MAVFFVLAQLTGGLGLDYLWPLVRFPLLAKQIHRLENTSPPPTVVCLGSSRLGTSIIDTEMTQTLRQATGEAAAQVFNASVPVGDPVVSEYVLHHLLQQGIRPRVVLLEMCPEAVNHRNYWIDIHIRRQLLWQDVPGHLVNIVRTGNLLRLLNNRVLPLYAHRVNLCQYVLDKAHNLNSSALLGNRMNHSEVKTPAGTDLYINWKQIIVAAQNPSPDLTNRTQAGLGGIQRLLRSYRPGGPSGAALERTILQCRRSGIEVILLGVPLASAHRQLYIPPIEMSYQAYVKKLCETYGCRFVDCRCALPDTLFLDHHHAEPAGGILFSRKFTAEVLAPIYSKERQRPMCP
jgi:hypothetical protein